MKIKRNDDHTPAQLNQILRQAYAELKTPVQRRKADAAIEAAHKAEMRCEAAGTADQRAIGAWERACRRMAVSLQLPSNFFI